jgi:hypothetical protein
VVDDGLPVSNGVYTTYIFGAGAFGWGEGGAPVPTETARDALSGDDILVNRRHFILHPRGVAFQNAPVATVEQMRHRATKLAELPELGACLREQERPYRTV